MAYENLEAGTYPARIKDWKFEVNPYLNTPELIVSVDFEVNGEWYSMPFKSLYFTKSGDKNKKTQKVLDAIGYGDKDPRGLEHAQLDTQVEFEVQVDKNDKNYWQIEWLNKAGEKPPKPTSTKTLDDFFAPPKSAAKPQAQRPPVKNYAPGASKPDERDGDDSIPF